MRVSELFNTMYKIPSKGIYCLINKTNKRIYIKHSFDICMSISRVLGDIRGKKSIYKQLIKDASKLQFLYLEDINIDDSITDIQVKMDHHVKDYLSQGYSLYNSKYKLVKFKVSIEVSEDLKLVYVKLCSRNKNTYITVGVFDKMYDAEEFAACFDAMDVIRPVYASNELTRKYFLSKSNHTVNEEIEEL